jgi:nitrate reductase NapAB chaperone NapD
MPPDDAALALVFAAQKDTGLWRTALRAAGSAAALAALPSRKLEALGLDAAALAIESLPGTQIYSRDPRGKLVVVIEATDVSQIGATLNTISLMPDVVTAALVFQATDEA